MFQVCEIKGPRAGMTLVYSHSSKKAIVTEARAAREELVRDEVGLGGLSGARSCKPDRPS